MKRVLIGFGAAVAIIGAVTGCSSQQTASANSEESIRTTSIAEIVAAIPTATPTVASNAQAEAEPANGAAPSDLSNMVTNMSSQE